MEKNTEALSQNSIIHQNLEIVDCLILVKMNCHSFEKTIKQRVLESFAMVHYHGCELFQIEKRID